MWLIILNFVDPQFIIYFAVCTFRGDLFPANVRLVRNSLPLFRPRLLTPQLVLVNSDIFGFSLSFSVGCIKFNSASNLYLFFIFFPKTGNS